MTLIGPAVRTWAEQRGTAGPEGASRPGVDGGVGVSGGVGEGDVVLDAVGADVANTAGLRTTGRGLGARRWVVMTSAALPMAGLP
jgi:hypothetical protein